VALGYRLVDLQVIRHDDLRKAALNNTQRTLFREPRRGEIRDSRGELLATSLIVNTVSADPTLLGGRQVEMARLLAPLLGTSEAALAARLQPRVLRHDNGKPVFYRSVILKHKVRYEEWDTIQSALKKGSFGFDTNEKLSRAEKTQLHTLRHKVITASPDDQLRIYPNQTLAAHVLGYTGQDSQGIDGIEKTFDAHLSGIRGWREIERDGRGREIVLFREKDVEPRPGLNVILTLDSAVQHIVEEELADAVVKHSPISASAVVVRPKTGEILAMATLPGFDPNHLRKGDEDSRRNRVISDLAEPGSTFKIVVAAGAISDQIIGLDDTFDCEQGRFLFAGRILRDAHDHYGVLSVQNIIAKSSNIGAAKIGIKMGATRLYEYIRGFGFGEKTGIPLGGEVRGIVHPVDRWSKLSISRIPMGHEVAVTPMQMIMAMSAIANQGRLMQPMLVNRLEDQQGNVAAQYHPQLVRQVISSRAAKAMVEALKDVATTNGTAAKAKLDYYTVAGKTGTAQKAGGPEGYLRGKYFSSFIGFFPADNPEVCISVVLDEPEHGYYGGQTAAPIFKEIAERVANYLNVRPDKPHPEMLTNAGSHLRAAYRAQ
jgi:cell division protein FtsI/penicillin-binding protein 2